jgi:hypothetical protein
LGGAAGSEVLIVSQNAGAGRGFATASSPSAGSFRLAASRTAGNSDFELGAGGSTGNIKFVTSGSYTEQARVSHTASAVNYVQVTGAATTATPVISAQGSDSQIDLALTAKGTNGWISLNTNNIRQAAIVPAASAVNYWTLTGSATTKSPVVSVLGTDTNISQVFQSKGTGAIDLAAGSKGVNISNGGAVTAITRTGFGTGYTSIPTVAVSAPTTAGGVQATLNVFMSSNSATIVSGGTGYTAGDVLTVVGGTGTAVQITVTTVSAGVITVVPAPTVVGYYSVLPTNPVSVTGGTGSGATFNLSYYFGGATVNNAGSGYVEQPTVSFSGGGGSGAAAYARIGGDSIVRSLGTAISFHTPGGEGFRITDSGTPSSSYWSAITGSSSILRASSGNALLQTAGSNGIFLQTNGGVSQAVVAHTASAVNYVQVTGSPTSPSGLTTSNITFTGSDSVVNGVLVSKGSTGYIAAAAGSANAHAFRVYMANAAATGNLIQVQGSAAGSSPSIQAISGFSGSDTNIDLTLTPKGTGNVRFGTYTASMALTVQGYIEIKDSGGTVRKLAVIA